MVLQKEILYALLGHTGQIVDGSFSLAPGLPLVDASERALLTRLLALGRFYRDLEAFVSASSSASPYLLAFALGLEECLQPYRARVLELEQTLIRTPDLSLAALQLGFGDFELTLPALHRLVGAVEHADLRGVSLLDHLHASAAGCVHSLRASLRVLLRHTQRVLRSQLAAWLLHGELLPGDGDFFVERARKASTDSTETDAEHADDDVLGGGWFAFDVSVTRKPAFLPMRVAERILFIGKAVRVLRASERRREIEAVKTPSSYGVGGTLLLPPSPDSLLSPLTDVSILEGRPGSPRALASPPPKLQVNNGGSATPRSPPSPRASSPRHPLLNEIAPGVTGARAALERAEEGLEEAELSQETAAVRELEAEAKARSLLASLAERGGGGKGGEAEVEEEEDYPAETANDENSGLNEPNGRGRSGGRSSAAYEMRRRLHSFGDELRALPMSDGSLQLPPLERLLGSMHRTASRLLWRHLTRECGLLELLDAISNYYLLGRGNIFHTLIDELRPLMGAHPPPLLDLQAALNIAASGEPNDPHLHAARLKFAGGVAAAGQGASAYDVWRSLTLDLKVESPLHLLVHSEAKERYAELFRFLLLVKRVQMELHAAWNTQTQSSHMPTQQRALLMPLWRLRAHMAFLIDNLQYYLQADVLEVQWSSLMQAAQTSDDFEELAAKHEQCLSTLHAQCFLQASSVSSALHQIFQLCLALCRMLQYAEAGARAEATYRSQFATVSREFSRQSAFLFAFLSNMSSPQQSPHLAQLLLRLDFNSYFGSVRR